LGGQTWAQASTVNHQAPAGFGHAFKSLTGKLPINGGINGGFNGKISMQVSMGKFI
jgi:hypothetical protein